MADDDAAFAAWVNAGSFDFADWLNAKMEANFISSGYLAQSIGTSRVLVNVWRRGAGVPSQRFREAIAAFFGIAVEHASPLQQAKPAPHLSGIVFR